LLYISGTAGDLRNRGNMFTSPLAGHFTILGFDQRGRGQTGKPPGPYSMADYANDAAGLIDFVGWQKCHVIGMPFGGMVAQELALGHRRKVERMVLGCTASGGAGGASYPLHELEDLPPEEQVRRAIQRTDRRRDDAWAKANPDQYVKLFQDQLAAMARGADDLLRSRGAHEQLAARGRHDTCDRLPRLDIPVLVCGGKYDGQAEPAVVENLAARIPGAELEFFEGGHRFAVQDPAAHERMIQFLLAGPAD
jgi:3-oxoadipate enol-lactonase